MFFGSPCMYIDSQDKQRHEIPGTPSSLSPLFIPSGVIFQTMRGKNENGPFDSQFRKNPLAPWRLINYLP